MGPISSHVLHAEEIDPSEDDNCERVENPADRVSDDQIFHLLIGGLLAKLPVEGVEQDGFHGRDHREDQAPCLELLDPSVRWARRKPMCVYARSYILSTFFCKL